MERVQRHSSRSVQFASADNPPHLLEGVLRLPVASGLRCVPAAVLCHPHPLTSDLHDPLLVAVAERLAQDGFATLRFNFRGVGRSQGKFTDGLREPLDLAGAVARLLEEPAVDPTRLCVIGHAFGAIVALVYGAHDTRVQVTVAVSPPVSRLTAGLGCYEQARMIVTGECDEVAPPHKLERWVETLPGGCALRVIAQGEHLLTAHAEVAADSIGRFLTRWAAMAIVSPRS